MLTRFTLFASVIACLASLPAQAESQIPPPPAAPAVKTQLENSKVVETTVSTGEDTAASPGTVQERLLWEGADVPPLCFDLMMMVHETVQTRISMPTCNQDPEKTILKHYVEDGWVRTDYRYKGDGADYPPLTAMYRVIGKTRDGYAIEMSSATGGSGRFTAVFVVKTSGPDLELVRNYGSGDRCNSGVASAKLEGNDVVYGFYVTPADFATIAFGDEHGLVAYEDLEASAMSCFAVQTYRNGRMEKITLKPEAFAEDQEGWTTNYALQSCMNIYLRKSVKAGKTSFTPPEFKQFMEGFLKSCKKA